MPEPAPVGVEAKPARHAPASPGALMSAMLARAEGRPSVRSLLASIELDSMNERTATFRITDAERTGYARMHASVLADLIEQCGGGKRAIEFLESAEPAPRPARPNDTEVSPEMREKAMQHPVVRKATELFDARVIDVRPEND